MIIHEWGLNKGLPQNESYVSGECCRGGFQKLGADVGDRRMFVNH